MTREEFIGILKQEGYSYEIDGDKIVVTHGGDVDLGSLKTIPPGVEFKNKREVYLTLLETLPPGVEFKNRGSVFLGALTTLPAGVEFKNKGGVSLGSLTTIHSGVEFKNKGNVWLKSLVGDMLSNWGGNIEGVDSKRLLNGMISKGIFER